ncbi:MAG TPA: carbonic anhydrase [Thermoanaerobaculia bacterium]|nr:carbonic anhydrase [Thermoanaerobaculia bacterium]
MRIAVPIAASVTLVFLAACASAPVSVDQPICDPRPGEWTALEKGNVSFLTGTIAFDGLPGWVDKQQPPVTVLACSDSRVPPELVFHQGVDRLFIVRSAGNVADTFGIASIEYAIANNWTKLLVVLAHEKCGAVEAAIQSASPTKDLKALVMKIRQSFTGPDCTLADPACWPRRTIQNAQHAVTDLKRRSPLIRRAIDHCKLPVVVAHYDVNGKVTVLQYINFEK